MNVSYAIFSEKKNPMSGVPELDSVQPNCRADAVSLVSSPLANCNEEDDGILRLVERCMFLTALTLLATDASSAIRFVCGPAFRFDPTSVNGDDGSSGDGRRSPHRPVGCFGRLSVLFVLAILNIKNKFNKMRTSR